jgi:MauM/NapG family ferredoxin protein
MAIKNPWKTSFQWGFLIIFTALFAFAGYFTLGELPADFFLRIDPLILTVTVIAKAGSESRLVWALAVVILTLLFGRFFCAYVCPTGAAIDILDPLFFKKKKRLGIRPENRIKKYRYYFLTAILVGIIFGVSLLYLLDPIVILTRFYALILYPLFMWLVNGFLDLFRPIFSYFDLVELSYKTYPQPVFTRMFSALLIFGTILWVNRYTARFWCRYLCPLGALLSVFSRLGLYKRKVSKGCNHCGVCQQVCLMDAIDQKEVEKTHIRECIQCRTCVLSCPQKAISFPFVPALTGPDINPKFDVSRRAFLYSAGAGVASAFLIPHNPASQLRAGNIIRPPGALPEELFLDTCTRCGECMRSCVTNTIQMSLFEAGLEGMWTPHLLMRHAGCEQTCNLCGRVCPTQAIRSIPMEDRKYAKIGTAVLKKESCLVWAQDKLCLICDEQCPYNAIVFKVVDGMRRPFVQANKCNGCGICENKCPIEGDSAIIVVPTNEIRLVEGPYEPEAKRLLLDLKEDKKADNYYLEQPLKPGELPPGFDL